MTWAGFSYESRRCETWIPHSLIQGVRFKLLCRQRPGWWCVCVGYGGGETQKTSGLLGTQTINTHSCIACCGPKSLHLSRQIDWTPGLVCLARSGLPEGAWGQQGIPPPPPKRVQLVGTKKITWLHSHCRQIHVYEISDPDHFDMWSVSQQAKMEKTRHITWMRTTSICFLELEIQPFQCSLNLSRIFSIPVFWTGTFGANSQSR